VVGSIRCGNPGKARNGWEWRRRHEGGGGTGVSARTLNVVSACPCHGALFQAAGGVSPGT